VRVVGDPPPQPVQRATATVWGGRVFVSRSDLARWLRSRGAKYSVWSERHPSRPVTRTQPSEAKSAPVTARRAGEQEGGVSWLTRSRLLAAGAVAAGCGVVAFLYRRIRRRELHVPALPRVRIDRRLSRRPAIDVDGFLDAIQPALRGAQRTTYYVLHRRSEVGWVVATSSLAIGVAVLLPHL
jgi:hypothetical protein